MSTTTILLILLVLVLAAVLIAGVYFAWRTRKITVAAERTVPPPGRFVEIDGNTIHYVDTGQGLPILFVHGLGGHLFQFTHPLFGILAGFRLVAPDRAGSGYSRRGKESTGRIAEQAAQLARLMEIVGLERPLVVGHSFGGAVALALALDFPDKVAGLALISPLTQRQDAIPEEFRPLLIRTRWLRWLIAYTVSAPLAIRNAKATLDFIFGPQQPPPDYATAGGAMALLRPSHFYGTSTDAVVIEEDMTAQDGRYGELNMPVGILFGDSDRVLDHRVHGLGMAGKAGNLDIELMEGAGHMPQYADPDRVAGFIRRMAEKAFAAPQSTLH
jgi:pimeloyl-ACP methyl ester carboxylesterase